MLEGEKFVRPGSVSFEVRSESVAARRGAGLVIGLFGGPIPSSVDSKLENRGLDLVKMLSKLVVFLFTICFYERRRRRRESLGVDVGHRMQCDAGKG